MQGKNRKIWKRLTAIFSFLLATGIVVTSVAQEYQGFINGYLGTATSKVVDLSASTTDTEYYKSRFGELSDTNLDKLIEACYQQVIEEEEEGAVLVRNENAALPLQKEERRITLFGRAVADPIYRGGGAGSSLTTDNAEVTIDLYEAFSSAGFEINDTLYNAYKESSTKRVNVMVGGGVDAYNIGQMPDIGEESAEFYTEELKESWANDYNDVAVIMLSRFGGEGNEMYTHAKDDDGTEISQLALYKDERDLLKMVQESGFEKTILLLNSCYPMELGSLDEYGVDACLVIGYPGVTGFAGVVNVLTGEANPSGHLVDTYATSSLSAPALVNGIDNYGIWENVDEVFERNIEGWPLEKITIPKSPWWCGVYSVQLESIYIGYRYYESRYEDTILGQGGASSEVGSISGPWKYENEIVYPFGYGLSYTTFEQSLKSVKYDAADDSYLLEVEVKNTGDIAGKSVVQVYAQTPYGDYERENLVEKSAIQLVGFEKTGNLESGETETVSVEVDGYLLASYDYKSAKGYILSEGDYYFAIGNDAHDALNNVLAAKGYDGLVDQDGNSVKGNKDKTYHFEQDELDTNKYKHSESTGVVVTNQFEDCDINYWLEDSVTYLSRQNWAETYPTEAPILECTEEMMAILNNETYTTPEDAPEVSEFTQGVDSGITFMMMKGVDKDDPMWETYLNQFTLEELALNATDANGIPENTSVGRPETLVGDGCAGMTGKYQYGDLRANCQYTSTPTLAATFNKEMIAERGSLLAEEALYSGITSNWGIGADLHRTANGGRNWEYFSECPNMTALCAEVETKAMLEGGLLSCVKHFCGNDQETWRSGLSTFYNEQAFREGSLRGFEGSLSWGGAFGLMQTMARQGVTFTPASYALNTQVLRNEWGFEGMATTDACMFEYRREFVTQLVAGTDNFCFSGRFEFDETTGVSQPGNQYIAAIESGDGYVLQCLRESVKNIHYALLHSNLINGLSQDAEIVSVTPWWKTALVAYDVVLGALTCIGIVAMTVSESRYKKEEKQS